MLQTRKHTKQYLLINTASLLCAVLLFYDLIRQLVVDDLTSLIILILTAAVVLILKFIRLYIILFGRDFSFSSQLEQYCKVVPVSILFPFKLGEVFRMYCYGFQMDNYIEGIISILFDRFVDTIALLTLMSVELLFGMKFSLIVVVLLIFSIAMFVIYWMFHPLYSFWNNYFISSPASKRRLVALSFLKKCNLAYISISRIITGKFLILYVLSIVAWGAELGGLLIINASKQQGGLLDCVFDYLTGAITGQHNSYMVLFSVISIIILIVCYLICQICKVIGHLRGRRGTYGI